MGTRLFFPAARGAYWRRVPAAAAVGVFALGAVALFAPLRAQESPSRLASVWYRGFPAGLPRASDLAQIRGAGFGGVTWPLQHQQGTAALHRMAVDAGLVATIRAESVPLEIEDSRAPGEQVDILVRRQPAAAIPALAWRAIARGARVVSFDAAEPQGTGLWDENGAAPWQAPASAFAVHLSRNQGLYRRLLPGSAVAIENAPAALDVVLLQVPRSWVLVATNASPARVEAFVDLPGGVPAAEWTNLLDASVMGMRGYSDRGPRWHADLAPWEARVYVIDKRPGVFFSGPR